MKKLTLLLAAAMISVSAFAHEGKGCCKKEGEKSGKACCQKEAGAKSCCKKDGEKAAAKKEDSKSTTTSSKATTTNATGARAK